MAFLRWARLATILASSFAFGSPDAKNGPLAVHESIEVPKSWQHVRRATEDDLLSLTITLKDDVHLNEADIIARSNPDSQLYGQYLSAAELRTLLSGNSDNLKKSCGEVQDWLSSNDITAVPNGNRISIQISASKAEALLGANFSVYVNTNSQNTHIRTQSYSLPPALQQHIDYIYPTVHFFDFSSSRSKPALQKRQHGLPVGPVTCAEYYCPQNISRKYNIDYVPSKKSNSSLAIAAFLEQYPDKSDFDQFFAKWVPSNWTKPAYPRVVTVNGGQDPNSVSASTLEAMLDLEYSTAFAGPLEVIYYSVGGRPPTWSQPGNVSVPLNESQNEPFLELLNHLLDQESVPQVISVSYTDDEQATPFSYATEVCNKFGQLALRGVSVLVASGDAGTQGTRDSDCVGPDNEPRFIPTFPASCPWVTAVGALAAYGGAATYSSGGFSNYFERPAWQADAVQGHIQQLNGSHKAFYNASGRAYPDFSLLGDYFVVEQANYTGTAKGTSASTPVAAAMIALLNDIRMSKGQPSLGFLNPLLYSEKLKGAFQDSTQGFIKGCASSTVSEPGFDAMVGWDAATGLGAPDFAKLRELLT
jgi:tripeptidyl-peptidase I